MSPELVTRKRMSARAIKAALRRAGFPRLEDFALAIGKGTSSVSEVIAGKWKSAYIAGRIADAIGKPPDAIWPRLYTKAS